MSKFLTNTLLLLSLVMIFTVKFITPVFTLNVQAFGAQNITETVDDLRKTTPKVDPIEPNSPFKNPDDYNWVDEFGVPCNPLSVKPAKVSKALSPWDYLVAFVTPIGVHAETKGTVCFASPKDTPRYTPEQQQRITNLDNELNAIDVTNPVKVDKYGYISDSNKPPQLKDKISLFREGNEITAYSMEEVKVILNDTGAKPKHGNWIDPPHTDSPVATKAETEHYHINTNKGTIILDFIK